jgi:hypothetical protein
MNKYSDGSTYHALIDGSECDPALRPFLPESGDLSAAMNNPIDERIGGFWTCVYPTKKHMCPHGFWTCLGAGSASGGRWIPFVSATLQTFSRSIASLVGAK